MDRPSPSKGFVEKLKGWVLDACRAVREAWQVPAPPPPPYLVETEMCCPKLQGVTLRKYRPEDFEVCRQLHDLNAPGRFPTDSCQQQQEYLYEKNKTLLVAEFEGKVIGCGGIQWGDPNFVTFVYGLVHPKYQQMGVGRLLFFGRVALLHTRRADTTICICSVKASLPYYQKFGFVTLGHGWWDGSGQEHPMAVVAVNGQIIERARDYLHTLQVLCPDLGIPKPEKAGLWRDLAGASQADEAAPENGD